MIGDYSRSPLLWPPIKTKKQQPMFVELATPFKENQSGTFGLADQMIIRQYNFPWEYPTSEYKCLTEKKQGLLVYREEFWEKIIAKYKVKPAGLGKWFVDKQTPPEKILECVVQLLSEKVDVTRKWTGFRITATSGKFGPLFSFELYAQPEGSTTLVYSENDAPNVG